MANENKEGKQTSRSRMVRIAKVCIDSFGIKSSLQPRPSYRLGERKQHHPKGGILIMAYEMHLMEGLFFLTTKKRNHLSHLI